MDEDDLEETELIDPQPLSWRLLVTILLEFIANIFECFHAAFADVTTAVAHETMHHMQQRQFADAARAQIEQLPEE